MSTFPVSGTLVGYTAAPVLQYLDDAAAQPSGTLTPTPVPIIQGATPTPTPSPTLVDHLPSSLPAVSWRTPARPWTPTGVTKAMLLTRLRAEINYWSGHIAGSGAMIDPFTGTEEQYATPCYAKGVATLVANGDTSFLSTGTAAMTKACADYANGTMPSGAGPEFWIPPCVEALKLFTTSGLISGGTIATWRSNLSTTQYTLSGGGPGPNWNTYASRGAWLQQQNTLITHNAATTLIESLWSGGQQARMEASSYHLWHDTDNTFPDALSVEKVGRGNLLAMAFGGYDGASATTIRADVLAGTLTDMLLQGPTGEAPNGGRTSDHIWVDHAVALLMQLGAEMTTDAWRAGQFRRAAMNAFVQAARWARGDGSFQVTKNFFDPNERVGYQNASNFGNYNGNTIFMLSDLIDYMVKTTENPCYAEIGGYAFQPDANDFAAAFANAGGMQIEIGLAGDTQQISGNTWSVLGLRRFGRPGWDTRLGPADGRNLGISSPNVAFGPAIQVAGTWYQNFDAPQNWTGTFSTSFVSPVLVICRLVWNSTNPSDPTFQQDLIITPDGVLSDVSRTKVGNESAWGMVIPLLKNDGDLAGLSTVMTQTIVNPNRAGTTTPAGWIASTTYGAGKDDQNFIQINSAGVSMTNVDTVRTSYGDVSRVRAVTSDAHHYTFVYPRNPSDPTAQNVRDSFIVEPNGFASSLGFVSGTLYSGRTSAGGFGASMSLSGATTPDVTFNTACTFILQITGGVVTSIETDTNVTATFRGQSPVSVTAFTPLSVSFSPGVTPVPVTTVPITTVPVPTWLPLPAGAIVTPTSFSFVHPNLPVSGNHTVSVRDASSPTVSGTSSSFTVSLAPPITTVPITTVPLGGGTLTRPASQILGFSHYKSAQNTDSTFAGYVQNYFNAMGVPYHWKYCSTVDDHIANIYWDGTGYFGGGWGTATGAILNANGINPIYNGRFIGKADSPTTWQEIINGQHDDIFANLVGICKAAGCTKLIYRASIEFNNDAFADSINKAPASSAGAQFDTWIACFRRIANVMHSLDTPTFKTLIAWNPNYQNFNVPGGCDIRRLYPGNSYVNVLTLDIYNNIYTDQDHSDWNADGTFAGTHSADLTTWLNKANNRYKFWNEPAAKSFNPNDVGNNGYQADGRGGVTTFNGDGLAGIGWGLNKHIAFAKLVGKPIGFDEIGCGYNQFADPNFGGCYIKNDPAFIPFIFQRCADAVAQGVSINHLSIFSEDAPDSHGEIFVSGTAPQWQHYFGDGGGTP